MKSIFLASFLLLFAESSSAQKTETTKTDKLKTTFYIGFGMQSNANFNINSKLAVAGLPQINQTQPEFSVGLNLVGPKYSSDIEVSTAISNKELNNTKNEYFNSSARIRLQRNLVKKTNMLFTAGANLAFTSSSLNVFADNNLIDLNNLANSINVNHLGLRNNMLYLGPSVSFTAFQKARFPMRLNVGYEFALTRGRWKSDFTAIDNTFGEFGKNRLTINLNLM